MEKSIEEHQLTAVMFYSILKMAGCMKAIHLTAVMLLLISGKTRPIKKTLPTVVMSFLILMANYL